MPFDPFSAGASVIGAGLNAYSARKAAKQQEKAAKAALAEEQRQKSQQRADQTPYRQLGAGAAQQYGGLLGIGGVSGYDDRVVGSKVFKPSEVEALFKQGYKVDDILKLGRLGDAKTSDMSYLMNTYGVGADDLGRLTSGTFSPMATTQGGAPDYTNFLNSPGYQFQLNQGKQAIERTAAARGGLASGNTLAALTEYGQGLAGQRFDTHMNQLATAMGTGQTATNALIGADQASSNNIADSYNNIGNARASGVIGQGNALADLFGAAGAIGSDWWQNRQSGLGRKTAQPASKLRSNPNDLMSMNYGGQMYRGYA